MKILKAIIAVVLITIFALPVFAFDTTPAPFKEFPTTFPPDYQNYESGYYYVDVSTSVTKLIIIGAAEGLLPKWIDGKVEAVRAVGVFEQEGSCFYVGSHGNQHLFITNAHVVHPSFVAIQESKNVTYITKPFKILSLQIYIGQNTGLGSVPAELIYYDETNDIAIVKVIGNWNALTDLGYRPVWTLSGGEDLLFKGMPIAIMVAIRENPEYGHFDKTSWFEVRYGTILETKPILPGASPKIDSLPWFSLNDVTMNIPIYSGDSGSPVFGFINGQPVIIGIARAAAWDCETYYDEGTQMWVTPCIYYTYFTRIDSIVPLILEK